MNYSVTCPNRIPMGPNILSGLDRIRITQTRLFIEEFLHCSCFDNKVWLLLDGLAGKLRFISAVICKSNVDFFFRRILRQESSFQ